MPPAALNEGPPVTPRPAATVLVVRGGDPWELLMVQRPGGADFAPGAYVFPGGAVHDEDGAWPDGVAGAAVRETFEETGILLARRGAVFAQQHDCDDVRSRVSSGSTFAASLRGAGLEPAFDQLAMFARWVTPAQLKRRFDTRFYAARLPANQEVRPQEGEVTSWLWIAPRRALETDEVTLVYATRAILESVADQGDLMAWARGLRDIRTVEPRIVQTHEGWRIVRD